jgi:hypothetical protein
LIVFAVAVLTVAAVLLVSTASKLRSRDAYERFRTGVVDLGAVPGRLAGTAAVAVIGAELTVLALVVVPVSAAIGLLAAGAVFTGFALVLARAVTRGAATGCHCFGASSGTVAVRHVVRTGFLALLALAGGTAGLTADLADVWVPAPATVLVVAVSALVVAVVVYLDEIVWLFGGSAR